MTEPDQINAITLTLPSRVEEVNQPKARIRWSAKHLDRRTKLFIYALPCIFTVTLALYYLCRHA